MESRKWKVEREKMMWNVDKEMVETVETVWTGDVSARAGE